MPKMRTHSGTQKRVKKTATGKVKVSHAFRGHLLSAKSTSAKRHHRKGNFISQADLKRIRQQIANIK
jgi:large subunit ribosomal protein L35